MYSSYSSVRKYFNSAKELLNTSKTLKDIFEYATSYKREVALTYYNDKEKKVSLNYKNYKKHALSTASKISEALLDIPEGSIIALKVANSPDWPMVFWGTLMNGFIPFLIDAKLPKANTENLIAQSKAAAIITNEAYAYDVKTVNVTSIYEFKENNKFEQKWANNVIFCSSGTTGNAKLVMYNGENIVHQVAACLDMPEVTGDIMNPGEINIIALIPFHHIFGFVAVFLWYTFFGKNIVFVRDLSPKEVMKVSQDCDVTHIYSVPLFWDSLALQITRKAKLEGEKKEELLKKMIAYNTGKISASEAGISSSKIAQKEVKSQLLGKDVKFCISGGGYITLETMSIINGIGYPLYNGYGMTEAGVISVELSPDVKDRLKGSIGKPLHGVEFKIDDSNSQIKGTGELLIKSPITHVTDIVGGVAQPTENEDGFIRTGDIATKDEDGRYYIKGRIKDVIINENGENIYPDEIEEYFSHVEKVNKVCVFGFKQGRSTHEEITCIIEIANDVDLEMLKIIKKKLDDINATLSNEKRVKEFLIAKDKMPLTTSLKIKRFQVKQLLKEKPTAFTSFDIKKEIKTFDGYDKKDVEPIVLKIRKIFGKILYLPEIKIGDDDHWINDLGGDSMSYVELIEEINKEFAIAIPEEKYALLTSVNEFAEQVLILKGVKKTK